MLRRLKGITTIYDLKEQPWNLFFKLGMKSFLCADFTNAQLKHFSRELRQPRSWYFYKKNSFFNRELFLPKNT